MPLSNTPPHPNEKRVANPPQTLSISHSTTSLASQPTSLISSAEVTRRKQADTTPPRLQSPTTAPHSQKERKKSPFRLGSLFPFKTKSMSVVSKPQPLSPSESMYIKKGSPTQSTASALNYESDSETNSKKQRDKPEKFTKFLNNIRNNIPFLSEKPEPVPKLPSPTTPSKSHPESSTQSPYPILDLESDVIIASEDLDLSDLYIPPPHETLPSDPLNRIAEEPSAEPQSLFFNKSEANSSEVTNTTQSTLSTITPQSSFLSITNLLVRYLFRLC